MSVLLRSARPAVRSVLLPATRMALVPARRLASQSQQQQQQQGNTWQTPVSAPLKEAAAEAAADVKHAAETVKDAAKLKVRQMQNNGTIEEAKMKAAELGVKAKNAMNSAAEQLGDIIDPTGAGKRKFHTSRQVAGHKTEDAFNELVDDATRLGQKVKNRSTQAGAEVKEQVQSAFVADDATRLKQKVENRTTQVGAEIKEQGQSLLHSAKKTVKKVSAAVSDAVDSVADAANTPSQPGQQQQQARQQPGQQPGQQTRQFSTKTTDSGAPKKPVPTASKPVQQAHDSPELSTSKRPGHVIGGQGESSQGEKMEGVKKSLFDGPQTMPQGVGKRAVDENGKPLETGAPRT